MDEADGATAHMDEKEERFAHVMADEFFRSTTLPTTNHQEWLLRRYAELMEREALVRLSEQRYRASDGRRRRTWRVDAPSSSPPSGDCTKT